MGVNSLPKTVTRQRRDCDLNPGPSAPESSTLTTRLPSRPNSLHNNSLYNFSLSKLNSDRVCGICRYKSGKLEYSTEFPGLVVEYSRNSGRTWSTISNSSFTADTPTAYQFATRSATCRLFVLRC